MFDLESFSPESVSSLSSEHVAVFLMATYGEGEPTDNAVSFFKYITNKDEPPSLPSLRYTVFGLGNKQYEHFNRVGKLTDRKLQDLGASRVFDYGEGDDDANLEEDFDHWKAKMWAALAEKYSTYVIITYYTYVHTCIHAYIHNMYVSTMVDLSYLGYHMHSYMYTYYIRTETSLALQARVGLPRW